MDKDANEFKDHLSKIQNILAKDKDKHLKEVTDILKRITQLFQQELTRSSVSVNEVEILADISRTILSVVGDKEKNLSADQYDFITEYYRSLRNMCAGCRTNQDKVHQHSHCIDCTREILDSLLNKNIHEQELQRHAVLLRCITQFIGNCITGHASNRSCVWQKSWQEILRKCIQYGDSKLSNYTCMVVHNCLSDSDLSEDTTADSLIVPFTELVLAVIKMLVHEEDFEFGMFVIEDCLKLPGFMESLDKNLSGEERLLVLEILINQLKNLPANESDDQHGGFPSLSYLSYLATHVKSDSLCILSVLQKEQSVDPQIVVKEIEVLGLASSIHGQYHELQEDGDLLTSSLYLLNSIEKMGQLGDNVFSTVDKVIENHKVDENHPAYGLKRDLIRLIGNMCYKHRKNQDMVRELDGIALILNQTNIDGRNPFITQWTVLAIHNLLEDNAENQAQVAEMRLQGLGDNSAILEEQGLQVEMRDGKVYVKSTKKINKEN